MGQVSIRTNSPESCSSSVDPDGRCIRGMSGDRGGAVASAVVRDILMYITVVVNVVSMVAMVAGILMHSGKGGGLSDMFGGGGGAGLGSAAAERNLNRITLVFALIWVITILALGFLMVR